MLKERTSVTPVVDVRERIPALDSSEMDPGNWMASQNRGTKDN